MDLLDEIKKAIREGKFEEKFGKYIRDWDVDIERYRIEEYTVIRDKSRGVWTIIKGNKIIDVL